MEPMEPVILPGETDISTLRLSTGYSRTGFLKLGEYNTTHQNTSQLQDNLSRVSSLAKQQDKRIKYFIFYFSLTSNKCLNSELSLKMTYIFISIQFPVGCYLLEVITCSPSPLLSSLVTVRLLQPTRSYLSQLSRPPQDGRRQ